MKIVTLTESDVNNMWRNGLSKIVTTLAIHSCKQSLINDLDYCKFVVKNNEVVAYVELYEDEKDSVEICEIVSKMSGAGRFIMDFLKSNYNTINADVLDTAKQFYIKQGFLVVNGSFMSYSKSPIVLR